MNRQDMLEGCPDEFRERLKEIIDDIYQRVSNIRDNLDIKSISDIDNVETAYGEARDLCDDLY